MQYLSCIKYISGLKYREGLFLNHIYSLDSSRFAR